MVRVQNFTPYDSANIHTFTLGATDTLTQTIYDREFALLRVSCLGADSIYVYNKVPAWHRYRLSKLTKGRLYYADEEIPLSPGYNERTITWREANCKKTPYTVCHIGSRPQSPMWTRTAVTTRHTTISAAPTTISG